MANFEQQLQNIESKNGFIAALDQSGGSTPKALKLYGIDGESWTSEKQMFDLVHEMRTRIITSSAFRGDKIIASILFENTMDRSVQGLPTAQYLWEQKDIVPILKVDKGLAEESDGVQLMKPMPDLDNLLAKAKKAGIFGTKMRSVIKNYSPSGIDKILDQQFEFGSHICDSGFVPIIEPEVDIHCANKKETETVLLKGLVNRLDALQTSQKVILKLTLPDAHDLYRPCVAHKNVARVVALSGGYSRQIANSKLAENRGVIASFSRALTEGLSAIQSDEAFNTMLANSIEEIYQTSCT